MEGGGEVTNLKMVAVHMERVGMVEQESTEFGEAPGMSPICPQESRRRESRMQEA